MMDSTAIGVWTGVITGLVAVVAWLSDRSRDRGRMRMETVRCLQDRFSTARMYRNRKVACNAFKSGNIEGATDAIDEIVDFFEDVAYYEEVGAIGTIDAWTHFFSYMYRFYHLAHEYIDTSRQTDPTVWQGFDTLYRKMYKIDVKDRRRQIRATHKRIPLPRDLPIEQMSQFIEEESNWRIDE